MIHMSTCEESSQGDKRIFEKPDREKEKKKTEREFNFFFSNDHSLKNFITFS